MRTLPHRQRICHGLVVAAVTTASAASGTRLWVTQPQEHSTMSCRCAGLCRGKGYGDGSGCCLLRRAQGLCVGGRCEHACCAAMRL